ncbi:hypothetical protein JOF46_000081 [Paeniglutamicibacter psychrophenolicus]|uniref:Uncharacterized protein n=1 Tax=Paeniglutamicibacter psychrophenolicus TaxID=257454 RepID=A0ABS4W7I7_9MICC|nr:hypothetical protein [Paeniglutamicibacter psychrophenolicus]
MPGNQLPGPRFGLAPLRRAVMQALALPLQPRSALPQTRTAKDSPLRPCIAQGTPFRHPGKSHGHACLQGGVRNAAASAVD